jgi:hypothetical protein
VEDRLDRVEALVEQLVTGADNSGNSNGPVGLPSPQGRGLQDHETVVCAAFLQFFQLLTPRKHDPDPENQHCRYEELCRALLTAWTTQRKLDIILSIPVGITSCLQGLICTPHSGANGHEVPSPRELPQLPPPGSHPVLVARKLLMLGSYLQAFPPSSVRKLGQLGVSHRDIMAHLEETAHNMVNGNDELVASIEGIECIMIESKYHDNAGNLRRSWLTMRRAMLIAQMMGLHRGREAPSKETPERRPSIRSDHIWFRIVHSDRYLSLMLGLPQGAPEHDFFATAKALEACTPAEHLQRIDCVAAGRILQRNEADINDLATTQEIDKLLQKASMSMPPQWWLVPNLAFNACDKTEHFDETIQIIMQLTHFHLVARLHLPYLLRSDRKYEYSQIMTINASREVLARFVAFCSSNLVGSNCRGIDFLVFIASTTLCLAHIDAYRQGQVIACDSGERFFFNSLVHQRPSDRGMMERALESVERMASTGVDMIASKIASIFRHLLVIEADAAHGSNYSASSFSSGEEELECGGKLSDSGNVLYIYIPSFRTIKIERGSVSYSTLTVPSQGNDVQVAEPVALELEAGAEDWALHGVDMALFDSLFQGSELNGRSRTGDVVRFLIQESSVL